ncbi:MAG: hypothetical protein C5B50_02320 [Verrucomicrobia bacterium]|nr:MAG: hypothetical protein C5B50_02320 [Verrucomicrobiota bacterium]
MDNMDNLEEQPQPTPESALDILQAKYDALSWLVGCAVVLLAGVAIFFDLYLRQRVKDVDRNQMMVNQQISEYVRNELQKNKEFAAKLQDYARTHPDFAAKLQESAREHPDFAPMVATILSKSMASNQPPPSTSVTKSPSPASSTPPQPTKK